MTSGLPLREIRTLLNKPGEEIDERVKKLASIDTLSGQIDAGYIVELDGNIEKDSDSELVLVGSVTTIPLPNVPAQIEADPQYQKRSSRRGRGDVFLQFWLRVQYQKGARPKNPPSTQGAGESS